MLPIGLHPNRIPRRHSSYVPAPASFFFRRSVFAHSGLFFYLCSRLRAGFRPSRAHSSVGQSSGLIIRRSWDHAPLGPLRQKEVASICSLFSFAPPQNVQQNLQQKRSPNILQPLFPLQSFGTLKFGFYYCKFRPSDSRSISRFAACRNI